jgi:hypothetical protein
MPRILLYESYAVYVFDERGQPHHLPHAHIKVKGRRVASIYLLTLDVFDDVERLPPSLLAYIGQHHEELLAAWERLNHD